MIVQINGGGFHNRGAQLMLWTVVDELSKRLPNVQFAVESGNTNAEQRQGYGLRRIVPELDQQRPRRSALLTWPVTVGSRLIPRNYVANLQAVRRCDVDAMVDISGYLFGDKWPPVMIQAVRARVKRLKAAGRPVVLLPQMFGPFKRPEVLNAFRPILDAASLAYARDEQSYQWLEQISPDLKHLRLAPDITIFSKPVVPSDLPSDPYVCLVPNIRMLDKAGDEWANHYVDYYAEIAKHVRSLGLEPHLVIHDGGEEDAGVAQQIASLAKIDRRFFFRDDDPRVLKGFISGAQLLVGSRFHALVAALSTSVPAMAVGWAHKYEQLFGDFGIPDYCVKQPDSLASAKNMIEQLADANHNQSIRVRLKERKSAMQQKNEQMWDEVQQCLLPMSS